jgi:hypothetical protein
MLRRSCLVLLTLIIASSVWIDVSACGDKFLRVGRSARFRRYASVHPSSILVYAPRWTRHGISEFEQMLKRAGHQALTVTTADAMSQAFVGGKYDMVITSYQDTASVTKQIETVPSRPALLPILYKATKAEDAEADATYRCLLKPEKMTPFQALEEIDRLIDLRLKDVARATPSR